MTRIRLAILGSGIFARDAHLPALKALEDTYEIVAVYSRNTETSAALAASLPGDVKTYAALEPLLSRTDIDAVDIILPISVQPGIITTALKAGKHVISEKPTAPDVASGRQLIQTAHEIMQKTGSVWMVAENVRYDLAFQKAAEIVQRGQLGKLIQFTWTTSASVNPENKYYHTDWRRNNSFPGGFLLDGGVHNIAAMRTIMGEVESVFAFVTQVRADLPPADTLSATLRFENGAFGIWTMTFVTESPWSTPIQVLAEHGALRVDAHQLDVVINGETSTETFNVNTIQAELADFARVIQGAPLRSTPEQALQDVAIIQAMLESAQTGCPVKPERIVSH